MNRAHSVSISLSGQKLRRSCVRQRVRCESYERVEPDSVSGAKAKRELRPTACRIQKLRRSCIRQRVRCESYKGVVPDSVSDEKATRELRPTACQIQNLRRRCG